MFGINKEKQPGERISLKISGMHCVSCGMNIDGALEDMEGVFSADTNFAQARTEVQFDASKVTVTAIISTIAAIGYEAEELL